MRAQRARDAIGAALAGLTAALLMALVSLSFASTDTPPSPTQLAPTQLAPGGIGALAPEAPPGFVGSAACAACHEPQTKLWLASQHAAAMSVATEATVKGDFADIRIGDGTAAARFFRDGPQFRVEIAGKGGAREVFTVTDTFGVAPLQQYLVTEPDGRRQVLPYAWDTRPAAEGGQRWFAVAGTVAPPGDALHWTGPQQNWNHMCAECHSTALRKGYDPATDRFHTVFSEISVGCESCHGAGAGHVAWAKAGATPGVPHAGFASVAALRTPADFTPDPATGSPAHGVARPAGDVVETCARCHSRRSEVSEDWRPGHPLTDTHLPVLLEEGLFEADGQNLDEVFNDHAFKQSLMFARGVTCTDCHDPHSGGLKAPGAEVCGQCHLPERFATPAHTGHPVAAGAPDCVSCHMPVRRYMQIDARHDHSFRIPRPDLSATLGTPNACNTCHADRTPDWATAAIARWHGPERKGFQSWGGAFHAARQGEATARAQLIALASDPQIPALVRASAVIELPGFPSLASDMASRAALADPDPMVRVAALRAQAGLPADQRWRRTGALLDDPSPVVRLEAAERLADVPPASLTAADRARLERALAAYERAQMLNADRPEARGALGNLRLRQGDLAGALAHYRAGLALDPTAVALRINLADALRRQSQEAEAEAVLREGLSMAGPPEPALNHALGLALVRQKRYAEALPALAAAARDDPASPTYAQAYAVALATLGQPAEAEAVVRAALDRRPNDPRLLGLALNAALRAQDVPRARALAERLSALQPDNADLARLKARLSAP